MAQHTSKRTHKAIVKHAFGALVGTTVGFISFRSIAASTASSIPDNRYLEPESSFADLDPQEPRPGESRLPKTSTQSIQVATYYAVKTTNHCRYSVLGLMPL